MAYDLEAFCRDTRAALKSGAPLEENLAKVAGHLSLLLKNPEFVASAFNENTPPGKEELYHDPELDFYVQAHTQRAGKSGTPHSHGESWAIYGNATSFTRMTEWRRVNPESEEAVVLEATETYELHPGDTRVYGPGVIHSTAHPEKAWVIRVCGTDLDAIPRYHFRKMRDRILEKA